MKLLLTSTAFTHQDIVKSFEALLDKPKDKITIAFVETASRTSEELHYVKKAKNELINLDIREEQIVKFDFSVMDNSRKLDDFDILYVCGGNTFYLMNEINKNGYRDEIVPFDTVKHYSEKELTKIWAFSDKSALMVVDNDISLIGEKVGRKFNF